MKMDDGQLLAIVEGEFASAMGSPDGEISNERALAWQYYLSKPIGNEIEGQSQVVSSDVSDVVDGLMPSLLRTFTVSENLVDFDPVDETDVAGAQQESDYVNYVFFKKNPAFLILYSWFFDALVQKNGIVKAWWDDSEEVSTETYAGLNDQELAELMDDDELEPLERNERTVETVEEVMTPMGMVQGVVESTVTDITFRRVSKMGRVRVENVPPEEYRISADCHSLDPNDARMVGHERDITRSDLLAMGFDPGIVEDLPGESNSNRWRSEETIARRDKEDDEDHPHDKSQDKIRVKEAYIRVDFDGDGRAELRQVIVAGNELLSNEEVDRQPFHVISPQPLPHKHFGRASAEKVMDVQEVNTTLIRQVLDNLYHTNNPGHGVWEGGIGEDTLDDLLTRRAGSVTRFARPVGESYAPMTVPFTAAASFPMIEYWDKVKRDRTGITADGEGLNPEQLKNIQTSVLSQASDLSRMKVEAVVRIFAETGVKTLFLHIHELLQKHQKKTEVAMLRNEWVQVSPQEWRTRRNMTVQIGLGIGTRDQNLFHLDNIWQRQRDIVSAGGMGTLVTPRNIFNTAAELVKNANLKQPTMFFTDPGDEPFQQPEDPNAELQQAQIALAERQQQIDAMRIQNDQEKLQLKAQVDGQKLQTDQEKIVLQHQRELEKLRQDQEKISNDLLIKMEQIANQLTEMELKHGQNVPGAKV